MFSYVTFLSDFGSKGAYRSACEAVVVALTPAARVMHISHEVAVGDVQEAALILARVAPLGPASVHLAVVDPGVGTNRRPVAIHAERGDFLVGPDNGLLVPAARALGGISSVWVLDPERVRRQAGLSAQTISRTFHGRDLFAPAAALLAQDMPASLLGEPAPGEGLTELLPSFLERIARDHLRAEVIEVDRFGNVALAVGWEEAGALGEHVMVEVEGEPDSGWQARRVLTFADLRAGELGLLSDSWGQAALSLNSASAAELLAAAPGSIIALRPGPER
jgi:S-adenosylmethionine hydrolase